MKSFGRSVLYVVAMLFMLFPVVGVCEATQTAPRAPQVEPEKEQTPAQMKRTITELKAQVINQAQKLLDLQIQLRIAQKAALGTQVDEQVQKIQSEQAGAASQLERELQATDPKQTK